MKTNKKKTIIIILVVVVLLILVAGVTYYLLEIKDKDVVYNDYTVYEGTTGSLEEYDPSMTVEGLIPGKNAYYITGKISSKKTKSFSVITFELYDKKGNVLGEAVAGLNTLEKDKVYDFKAIALVNQDNLEKIDHYKLKSVKLGNGE